MVKNTLHSNLISIYMKSYNKTTGEKFYICHIHSYFTILLHIWRKVKENLKKCLTFINLYSKIIIVQEEAIHFSP